MRKGYKMDRIEALLKEHARSLMNRDPAANKGSYGKLLVIAGSKGMAGAAYLNSIGAFRTGIGMVKILGPEANRVILQTSLPEAMYVSLDMADGRIDKKELTDSLRWADYVSVGSGLSRTEYAEALIELLYEHEITDLLREKKLLILDADALNIIADSGRDPGVLCPDTVITPHVGEMSRLTGINTQIIKADPAGCAESYRSSHGGITVVLKDHQTAIAGKRSFMIDSGCGAMAKAGSGDVLCGFIAGVSGVLKGDIASAVPIAVWLHGRAGSIAAEKKGCHSLLAGDIADAAGDALRSLGIKM